LGQKNVFWPPQPKNPGYGSGAILIFPLNDEKSCSVGLKVLESLMRYELYCPSR